MYQINDLLAIQAAFLQQVQELAPQTTELIQLRIPIQQADLLLWLAAQMDYPRFFWTSRKRVHQLATIGAVKTWTDLKTAEEDLQATPTITCYGGWGFQEHSLTAPWQDWPACFLFIPRWELRCQNQLYHLCLNLTGSQATWSEQIHAACQQLQVPLSEHGYLPLFQDLQHQPDYPHWARGVEAAQDLFQQHQLDKLVLSRESRTVLADLPLRVMHNLLSQQREAYHFWLQLDAEQVLWGASPERLFARQNQLLFTEALAGTRPCPPDQQQQQLFQQELLHSHKEFEENERVRQHLEQALCPLVSDLQAEPLRVIPAGPVQHLYRCLQAQLKPDIKHAELLKVLHPTPAVSGFPAKAAIQHIQAIESHCRGWYTGAIGWMSGASCEWSVVLRCALWRQQNLYFYSGAGIMPASEPQQEWDELNVKLESLLNLWQDL